MNILSLCEKPAKLVVGLMSGTSADGIDAALVKIRDCGTETRLELLAFNCFPYTPQQKEMILKFAVADMVSLDEFARFNVFLGHLFADAALMLIRKSGFQLSEIDLIGSHGQTIRHLPKPEHFLDCLVSATLQIGEPAVIAQRTGVITVADFRPADIAAGGEGAPLVPLFDYLLFHSENSNRVLLNIGGIANVTILPKNCTPEQVIAFDSGPGNMIVDNLCKTFFARDYDQHGDLAASGKVNYTLVNQLLQDEYLLSPPPKSTGRERYGIAYFQKIIELARVDNLSPLDLLATMTFFTVKTISTALQTFYPQPVDEIIVSGGGVNNFMILRHLQDLLPATRLSTSDQHGVPADAKEAVCFAVLANETIHQRPGNMPSATGATRPVVLGKVCLP
ncbi:MAG TPA: anhydro-N-acetylmuramic acid kinase [bacterium]|nr:anhydro-N-acetylmuramic acid kinase [bacterium]HPN42615.1 anhydro-N-acetylmuramic acid kinase [bacterium]